MVVVVVLVVVVVEVVVLVLVLYSMEYQNHTRGVRWQVARTTFPRRRMVWVLSAPRGKENLSQNAGKTNSHWYVLMGYGNGDKFACRFNYCTVLAYQLVWPYFIKTHQYRETAYCSLTSLVPTWSIQVLLLNNLKLNVQDWLWGISSCAMTSIH